MIIVAAVLHELSEPRPRGEKVSVAIARAADLAGLSYWRAFEFWYHKARSIEPSERQSIAAAIVKKRREHACNERRELKATIARLEKLMANRNQRNDSEDVNTIGDQLWPDGRARINRNSALD